MQDPKWRHLNIGTFGGLHDGIAKWWEVEESFMEGVRREGRHHPILLDLPRLVVRENTNQNPPVLQIFFRDDI